MSAHAVIVDAPMCYPVRILFQISLVGQDILFYKSPMGTNSIMNQLFNIEPLIYFFPEIQFKSLDDWR